MCVKPGCAEENQVVPDVNHGWVKPDGGGESLKDPAGRNIVDQTCGACGEHLRVALLQMNIGGVGYKSKPETPGHRAPSASSPMTAIGLPGIGSDVPIERVAAAAATAAAKTADFMGVPARIVNIATGETMTITPDGGVYPAPPMGTPAS